MVLVEGVHEYLVYVGLRVTPLVGSWPPLQKCLDADRRTRSLWVSLLRQGHSMDEAITRSKIEMHGFWLWASEYIAEHAKLNMNSVCNGSLDGSSNHSASGTPAPAQQSYGPAKGAGKQDKGKRNQPYKQSPGRPALMTAKGRKICSLFNGSGCSAACPNGDLHFCNYVDARGTLCGQMGKPRRTHPR